jgi:hypothetical protein
VSTIGSIHLVFSPLAIAFGGFVLRWPKATRWHRTWGHGYAWSMLGVVATSFPMFNLTGRVTPFHLPALESTIARNSLWPAFWRLVAVGSFGTFGAGALWLRRASPASIADAPAAMRRERSILAPANAAESGA